MPIKDPVKRREYSRRYAAQWYAKNRQKQITRNRLWRQSIQNWFAELKATFSCRHCGESHIACLEFHHDDPKNKETTVHEALWRKNWGKKRIMNEAAKCTVLCSNCHRKHHWDERNKAAVTESNR